MKKKYLILLLGLVTILIAGLFLLKGSNTTQTKTITRQSAPLPKEITVILDKGGFRPNVVTVKAGTAVRWLNESGDKQTVNSDDYPTNQLHKELNFGIFNNGSSVVYIFKTPGAYGYHNQLNPKQSGKIIVE
jgi:plastocyanin